MSDAVADTVRDKVVAILAEQAVLDARRRAHGRDPRRPRHRQPRARRGDLRHRGGLRHPGAVQRQRPARSSEFDISTVATMVRGRRVADRGREIGGAGGSSSPGRAPSTPSAGPPPRRWPPCAEGRSGIGPLEFPDVERLSIAIGGQIRGYDPEAHFGRQELTLYDRFTQFALLAAREAVAQSGLEVGGALSERAGVVLGTSGGGLQTQDENYRLVYQEGKNRVHPFVVPRLMNNAAASHVSMALRPAGAELHGGHRLRLVEPRHGTGDGADPRRARRRGADRRQREHALLRRHQGLGGPAGDVEGRLPAVLERTATAWCRARGRRSSSSRSSSTRGRAGRRSWPRWWASP